MYIQIDIKCIASVVCRSKIVKARLNGIIGHFISDLLDEFDNMVYLKIARIESSNTSIHQIYQMPIVYLSLGKSATVSF